MAVHPVGVTVEEMAVVPDLFMKISLQPKYGQSRMSHLAALRKEFSTILRYIAELKEKREGKAAGDKGEKRDRGGERRKGGREKEGERKEGGREKGERKKRKEEKRRKRRKEEGKEEKRRKRRRKGKGKRY